MRDTYKKALFAECLRLAELAFDAEMLNDEQVVVLDGSECALKLDGWDDKKRAWRASEKGGATVWGNHPADVFDLRAFMDFLLGRRGMILVKSGDTCAGDEARRFSRFEAAGGVFGSHLRVVFAAEAAE